MCAAPVFPWQTKAFEAFCAMWQQSDSVHAPVWLLSGSVGTGLSEFAMQASARWLDTTQPDHPDRLRVQPAAGHKEITVEQVRDLGDFMHLTSLISPRRAVIIDTIDALNQHAVNALLKSLEEPPARTLCLLVCHRPYALLPTLRSRCMELRLPQPTRAEALEFLATEGPEMEPGQYGIWLDLAGGAPLTALDLYAENGLEMLAGFPEMLAAERIDMVRLHQWLAKLSSKDETAPLLLLRYTQQQLRHLLKQEKPRPMMRELLAVEAVFTENIHQLHAEYVDAKSLVLGAFSQLQSWFQKFPRSA
jgi:hypothetical protein